MNRIDSIIEMSDKHGHGYTAKTCKMLTRCMRKRANKMVERFLIYLNVAANVYGLGYIFNYFLLCMF